MQKISFFDENSEKNDLWKLRPETDTLWEENSDVNKPWNLSKNPAVLFSENRNVLTKI